MTINNIAEKINFIKNNWDLKSNGNEESAMYLFDESTMHLVYECKIQKIGETRFKFLKKTLPIILEGGKTYVGIEIELTPEKTVDFSVFRHVCTAPIGEKAYHHYWYFIARYPDGNGYSEKEYKKGFKNIKNILEFEWPEE